MTRQDLKKLVKIGLVLPAISLLLMLVFFVVLPRTRHPLWNFLNPSSKGQVGLAETVQPGSFSEISANNALAFRAEGPELAPEDRYWRALVLNQPKEGRWVRSTPPKTGGSKINGPAPLSFTIYPEPRSDHYLMTLDRPLLIDGIRHKQTVDQMYIAKRAIDHRLRYEVRASPGAQLKVSGDVDQDFYLRPPLKVSPRIRELANGILTQGDDVSIRIEALANFFRNQELSYAQDDLPFGPNAIDSFLFEKKRGYCEFFASAYITLARLAGVPARLVGGYFGGDYNPMGGYYLVGEATAHVWVEVLANNNWQRVDPSQWAINAETTLGMRDREQLNPFQQLVDSLNYYWVQAVVVFDLKQQITIFRDTRAKLRNLRSVQAPEHLGKMVVVLFLGMGLIVCAFALRRKPKEVRLLGELRKKLRQRYGKDLLLPGSGLAEIGEQVDSDVCREFARIYYGAIFRDRSLTAQEFSQLKNLLKEL